MKNFARITSLAVLLVALCGISLGQTSLVQTTLTAAVPIGPASLGSGAQGNASFQVAVASATGITGAAFGAQPVTFLYVDQELMGVIGLVQGQTLIFNVLRSQEGTRAAFHKSGAMVLIGTVTPQFGGQSGSGGFQKADPPLGGVCNLANTLVTPWINIFTGYQFLCTAVAGAAGTNGVWVPGWNNPLAPAWSQVSAAVANAATFTPTSPYFHLTGAGAFVTITLPVGFEHGCVNIIMDAADTWTAAGNIIVASAAAQAAGEMVTMCWDPLASKWYPSHV